MKKITGIVFLVLYFLSLPIWAQKSIGLYEGLMANTGVAIEHSMAPSYYNPALLSERKENSYVIGGNAFTVYKENQYGLNNENSHINSQDLSATYLSSIQKFETYSHEFFLYNEVPAQLTMISDQSKFDFNYNVNNLGYTMAWQDFPFGFQFLLTSYSVKINYENHSATNASTTYHTFGESDFKAYYTRFKFGGIHDYDHYRFGYSYNSRMLNITKTNKGYYYNYYNTSGSSYTMTTGNNSSVTTNLPGEEIKFGHSFVVGKHEFLTDTIFIERSDLHHAYDYYQTFGYKFKSKAETEVLCGTRYLLNSTDKLMSQDFMYTVGMAWLKNTYRSSIGLMYNEQHYNNSNSQIYGLTFNSEFRY